MVELAGTPASLKDSDTQRINNIVDETSQPRFNNDNMPASELKQSDSS
jgi:hypothetical protein